MSREAITIAMGVIFTAVCATIMVLYVVIAIRIKNGEAPADPPRTNISARASYLNMVISVNTDVKEPLESMIMAAEWDGMCLVVLSGHRTLEQQQEIYDRASDKSIVAAPGKSEHEQGIAVDLGGCPMINGTRNDAGVRLELKNDFDTLPEYKWLLEHASGYGFVQSYTEGGSSKSGFPAEPWHWKFVN
jgi:D-alanyl-D-alanine carboxypeptidase